MYIIFAILIGALSAAMDRLAEPVAFNNSIFRNKDPKWWLRSVSWQYVKFLPLTKYRPDAWHLCQSAMYLCIGGAAGTAVYDAPAGFPWWGIALIVAILVTFGKVLFYDYILKR